MSTVHLPNVRHLTTDQVHAEVNACHGAREVSDACAVTIASWYASPGVVGRHLAALATGAPVDRDDLVVDLSETLEEHYATSNAQDKRCLDMLGTWVLRRSHLYT